MGMQSISASLLTSTVKRARWYPRIIVVLICIVIFMTANLALFRSARCKRNEKWSASLRVNGFSKVSDASTSADTLVLYTFSDSDPEYYNNFLYFVDYGLGGENVHYIFILQEMPGSDFSNMPLLPQNARYVTHANECYDWGTFGWFLNTGKVDIRKHKYFIFMNSSVRGPFLPSYHKDLHWTEIYTSRLSNSVKLVGSTINCQPVYWRSDPANEMRQNPHVQSYVMATDRVGLGILKDDGNVFGCYKNLLDTIWHSEVGASRIIFEAGYTIDALMMKYTGVDWRNKSNWQCNGWQNPYADFAYDGLMINPLEVLFVKVKSYQLESDWITSKMANTYERWQRAQGQQSTTNNNNFDKARFSYFLSKAITMSMRGSNCFDLHYYKKMNPDIPNLDATWQHFVNQGQFEGRPFRFTCENQFAYPAKDILLLATKYARQSINISLKSIANASDKST